MSIQKELSSIITAVKEELGSGSHKRGVVLFDGTQLSAQSERFAYRFRQKPNGTECELYTR